MRPTTRAAIKVAWGVVGTVVGFSAGAAFGYMGGYSTAGYAGLSGLFAACFVLFAAKDYSVTKRIYRRGVVSDALLVEAPEKMKWKVLRWIAFIGAMAGIAVGVSGIAVYAMIAQANHESLNPKSHWLTIVWSFMTIKWSGALFWETGPWQKKGDVALV